MLTFQKSGIAALCLALAVPFAAADPTYRVTPLAHGATAINNLGQTTGSYLAPSGQTHAFIESGGTLTDLGSLGGNSFGARINDLGQVAGTARGSDGLDHVFIYAGGALHDLGTRGSRLNVTALNNRGVAAGNYVTEADGRSHPYLMVRGAFRDLPLGTGYDAHIGPLNDSGVGAGVANNEQAVLWREGEVINIGAAFAERSFARDINNSGQVAGVMEFPGANIGDGHAFLYSGGTMTDLGTLGGFLSDAAALNNKGQVVGWAHIYQPERLHEDMHAFLYTGGEMIDLNTQVDPAGGWQFDYAFDINDSAQILAHGCRGSDCSVVRLDPIAAIPEPSSVAMLLGGLALAGVRWRRRGQA